MDKSPGRYRVFRPYENRGTSTPANPVILSPAPLPGITTGSCNLNIVMNRQVHLIIGGVLFLVYAYVAGLIHPAFGTLCIFGFVATAAGSIFPDILEPPTSAHHRGFFHSRRALKEIAVLFLLTAMPVLFAPGIPRFPLVFSTSCFFLGYAAHLAADSLTRAGLPK